ncbi:hypothetical protein OG21DRAFT_1497407 [Imleria badia]|nr:hypothetical protein OG21DRAFT_1497407 [Imleria badia]
MLAFGTPIHTSLENRLLPVVEALKALGCLPSINNTTQASTRDRPRILVHSLSNGGAFQVISLGRLLSSKYPSMSPSNPLVSALILDSSPAIGDFRSIGMAFSIAIPNPLYRCFALVVIYILHVLCLFLYALFGVEYRVTRYGKALLNPRLLPWMNSQTPRLYVFSKKDKVVPWQAVQQHVETAKKSGLNVRCEVYEESAHVAHVRLDPERYWASIQDLWQSACRQKSSDSDRCGRVDF